MLDALLQTKLYLPPVRPGSAGSRWTKTTAIPNISFAIWRRPYGRCPARLLDAAEAGQRLGTVLRLLLVQAQAVAAQQGYVQTFVAEGEGMGDLCCRLPYACSMMNDSTGKHSHYHIEIEGHLDDCWQDWFEGFALIRLADGRTVLSGPIRDQTALHGVLKKINNLGLTLISVNPRAADHAAPDCLRRLGRVAGGADAGAA